MLAPLLLLYTVCPGVPRCPGHLNLRMKPFDEYKGKPGVRGMGKLYKAGKIQDDYDTFLCVFDVWR